MKIGCGEWGFRERPIEEHFSICRSFGFHTMEIGIGGGQVGRLPEQMTAVEIEQFKAMCKDYRIATPYCCLENDFTLADADEHRRMLEAVLAQMRLAAKLGAKVIRLFAGFTPYEAMTEDRWERLEQALQTCAGLCRELGLRAGIETHGKITLHGGAAHHQHTVSTAPEALRLLLAALPPEIGINYDPGNLKAVAPQDETCLVDLLRPHINYCHLKDWRRQGSAWEACAPGDDDLDYARLIPQIGFDGVYLIEYEPLADVEDGIRRSLDYLGGLFPLEYV